MKYNFGLELLVIYNKKHPLSIRAFTGKLLHKGAFSEFDSLMLRNVAPPSHHNLLLKIKNRNL
jgi:hypothetical protein